MSWQKEMKARCCGLMVTKGDPSRCFLKDSGRVYPPKCVMPISLFARLCLALVLACSAFANNSKISPDLQPLLTNSANNVNVIVQYNSPLCAGSGLTVVSCPAVNLLGGVVKEVFTMISAVAATLP